MIGRRSFVITIFGLLSACATIKASADADGFLCRNGGVTLFADFPGARAGDCAIAADGRFLLTIAPEHAPPINPSPWYAFRIEGSNEAISVELQYLHADHRYLPKMSGPEDTWTAVAEGSVVEGRTETYSYARFDVPAGTRKVAAQPIFSPSDGSAWLADLAQSSGLRVETIGQSHDGRPIELIDTQAAGRPTLLLLGGQHPPEVTGQVALRAFLETLFSDAPLAGRFRSEIRIVAIPMLNPDGVARGHWRANLGGVDLNRDWGPFTQPETRSVQAWLERERIAPAVVLDFHSTNRNLFYIQGDAEPTTPAGFAQAWLTGSDHSQTPYEFEIVPTNANPSAGTSKNYFHRKYGIPAITYEVGDDTDLRAASTGARNLARDLMVRMLGD